jgi:rRNA maturation endonuclease Nob1
MTASRVSVQLEENEVYFEQMERKYCDESTAKSVQDAAYSEISSRIEQPDEDKKESEINLQAHQGKKRCENCQNIVLKESKYCNMCGQPLQKIYPLQRTGKKWGFGKA